jgi:pre-mRNA-splicing factor SYF2
MDVKERLAALKRKRMAAKTANHRDVVEEDRVAKLPANFEAKKERAQYELGEIERKKEIEASGDFFTQFFLFE